MATGQYASAPALDHRARAVAAIRLRRWPDGGRAQGGVVGGMVGVVPIPGGGCAARPHRTQCLRRTGPDLPDPGRGADLPAPGQREDRHHRTHRRGPGPQPRSGHLRAVLRHLGADVPTRRPGIQRRGGERRQTCQGRHRAHRDEPARPVRQLRRGRSRMCCIRRRDQFPRAPRNGSAPDRDAQPGTPVTARGSRSAAHRGTGGDPAGPRQHPDGHLRALPILLTRSAIRSERVDQTSRRHRRSRHLRAR
jgi:hypothetical protein